MQFVWDRRKASINLRKHRIAFADAITIFSDPLARIFADPDHSETEQRELSSATTRLAACSLSASPSGTILCVSSALDPQPPKKDTPMKHTSNKPAHVDLRNEYAFDYSKSKPNRFAAQLKDTRVVVLQPDVAKVFQSAKAVNDLLRSAIAATGHAPSAT